MKERVFSALELLIRYLYNNIIPISTLSSITFICFLFQCRTLPNHTYIYHHTYTYLGISYLYLYLPSYLYSNIIPIFTFSCITFICSLFISLPNLYTNFSHFLKCYFLSFPDVLSLSLSLSLSPRLSTIIYLLLSYILCLIFSNLVIYSRDFSS